MVVVVVVRVVGVVVVVSEAHRNANTSKAGLYKVTGRDSSHVSCVTYDMSS